MGSKLRFVSRHGEHYKISRERNRFSRAGNNEHITREHARRREHRHMRGQDSHRHHDQIQIQVWLSWNGLGLLHRRERRPATTIAGDYHQREVMWVGRRG